ncbi:MAG: hypothetical protein EVA65_13425 [Oceanococcus sp.]|nr:MAG: hypothetical protein EVA65_13425 [Oceanococcus sp.]
MSVLAEWFHNSLVQSMLLSPLVGAILGILFSGLNSSPKPSERLPTRVTMTTIRNKGVHHHYGRQSNSQDDAIAYIALVFGVVAAVVWGYSRYVDQILVGWTQIQLTCGSFIVAAGTASAMKKHFTQPEWWWHIALPLALVVSTAHLSALAHHGAALVAHTHSLAWSMGWFDYYLNGLSEDERMWILLQAFGVFMGIIATITAATRGIHYLALMNQRSDSPVHRFWFSLSRASAFSGGTTGIAALALTNATSYFALSGKAFQYLTA